MNLTIRDGMFKYRIIFKKRKENHKNKTGCLDFLNILDDIYADITVIFHKSTKDYKKKLTYNRDLNQSFHFDSNW